MQTLTIDLPDETAERLRDEAARRRTPPEQVVARWLIEQLRTPAEFEVTDKEAESYVDAVHRTRSERHGS